MFIFSVLIQKRLFLIERGSKINRLSSQRSKVATRILEGYGISNAITVPVPIPTIYRNDKA